MSEIAIIGMGLIGGSLALSLRRGQPGLRILGVDSTGSALELALAAGAIDQALAAGLGDEAAWLDRLAGCDAVVLAIPAPALAGLLPRVAARMRPGAVLTDVCGAKERVCALGAAQDRVVFVGAHPMAGTEFRGFAAASTQLFAGATVALCPPVGHAHGRDAAAGLVSDLWRAAGAGKLLPVGPIEHDRAIAYASHLPYLAAAVVVESLGGAGEAQALARELAAGGFRDTTRLAGDGTVGGAASLNRFVPAAARDLAERLRALALLLEADPAAALTRLGALADERRQMRLPRAGPKG